MISGIITILALRGVLAAAKIDLGKIDVLAGISLGDLGGSWLSSWGERLGGRGLDALQRLGQIGGLPQNHDLRAAERRALATGLCAFHRALAARRNDMSPAENHWIDGLEALVNRLSANDADGEALYFRCEAHIQAHLKESDRTRPDFVRLARGEFDTDVAAMVYSGILKWLTEELQIKPTVDTATPVWARGLDGHDPTTESRTPKQAAAWLMDPDGFPVRPAEPKRWRHFWRRPPVARPEIQTTLLNAWAQCFIEELKTTPRAFSAHLIACLDDLKGAHPALQQQLEAAKSQVDATLAAVLQIEEQLAELLGTTAEKLRLIHGDVGESRRLLSDLITGQADQSEAWQRVDAQLVVIKSIMEEGYGPPIDNFMQEPVSAAKGPDIEISELVYRSRWMRDLLFREDEMAVLCAFLDGEGPYAIHVLTGDAGSGKSRLALELVLRAQAVGWRAGFLQSSRHLGTEPQLHKWHPTRSTLLVIDYASEHGPALAEALASLSLETGAFAGKLRVLLIDRRDALKPLLNDQETFGDKGHDANRAKVRRHLFAHLATPDSDGRDRAYEEAQAALVLQPWDLETCEAFIRAVFKRAGQPDHALPSGWDQKVKHVTKGRPLLLTVLALHFLRSDSDESARADLDSLLDEVIDGEVQKRWRRILAKSRHPGGALDDLLGRLQRLVAVVTLCRGLSLTAHAVTLRAYFGTNTSADRSLLEALKEILGVHLDPQRAKHLRPLEPDLLAERFLLRGGSAPPSVNEFDPPADPPFSLDGLVPPALSLDRDGVVATTALLRNDYPEVYPGLLPVILESLPDAPGIMDEQGSFRAYDEVRHPIIALWGLSGRDALFEVMRVPSPSSISKSRPVIESLLNWAARSPAAHYGSSIGAVYCAEVLRKAEPFEIWATWNVRVLGPLIDSGSAHGSDSSPSECLLTAMYAVNVVNAYGTTQRWDDLERWGERLQATAGANPGVADIQLALAMAVVNAVNAYGTAQRWEDLERWGERLRATAGANPGVTDIQFRLVQAAFNAVNAYATAQRWDDLERWGERLDATTGANPGVTDIHLTLAKAAVNAVNAYGTAQRWDDLERWGERLEATAGANPGVTDIQLRLVQASVNAVNDYGTAQRWEDLERWGERLEATAGANPGVADIQLALAETAVNAMNDYGTAQRWEDLERWGERLQAIAGANPGVADIQLELAKAAVNAVNDYGTAQRWEDLERWGARLDATAGANPGVADIQLRLAQAAFNAVNAYGTAQRWKDLERWGARLDATAGANPGVADIQLELAQAAFNAVNAYATAQRWKDLERWGARLEATAGANPGVADIQLELAQAAVNAVNAYGSAKLWDDLERWGARLEATAGTHQGAAEIQLRLAQAAVNAVNAYGSAQRWEDQRRWAGILQASLPERLTSQDEAQVVQQIYQGLLAIQHRDQQPALQAVLDFIEQRYAAPSAAPNPESGDVTFEDVHQNWASLPEELRAALRPLLASKGIAVDHLPERMAAEGRSDEDESEPRDK